ncbi:MAG TPA: sulfatase, partial [Thermoanaerobaculia bacterium]
MKRLVGRRRLALFLVLLLVAAVSWAVHGSTVWVRGAREPLPDVILISIDTLRADHLGCYGYRAPTSPNLDRFRADSVLFTSEYAQAPATLPSHASLSTSLLPQHHNANHGWQQPLPASCLTLTQVLRQSGYRTASFNDGGQLDAKFGLDHGFQLYRSLYGDSFGPIVDSAVGYMEGLAGQVQPMFLFLHTYEVHHPYTPTAANLARMEAPYTGRLPHAETTMDELTAIKEGRLAIDGRDLQHIVATYDGEIRAMDEAFGRLVAYLKQSGRYERTLIVFTSDHGEEFGEHGTVGWHAHTLYDELLHVPLLLKLPHGAHAGGTLLRLVRSLDVAPTVLAAVGRPVPKVFEGRDLLPFLDGDDGPPLFAISRRDSST